MIISNRRFTGLIYLLFVFIMLNAENREIRGVWIPDPGHTSLMHTYRNIKDGVADMKSLGINTLFLCTYAKTEVAFKSDVYTKYSAFNSPEDSYMFSKYMDEYNQPEISPSGDPVRDLIDEAANNGMNVVFWFEYGFMGSHGPTPPSHPLLVKNPEWQSAGSDGKQAAYNKTDYYFNAYHPEVQEFLIELMEESIKLYPDVKGIQGDDRTPAMPRNSGYDAYTVSRYKSEHDGQIPPADYNEEKWVDWRLNILNTFAKNLYGRVKSKGSQYLVCFAPNPYPWCKDNLMQDSQSWLKDGVVDLLSVQCYRFDNKAYEGTVREAQNNIGAVTDKLVFNPGIILKVGQRYLPGESLKQQILINRALGTNGETFFYNEGLKNKEIRSVLQELYK
ncbi:MAG: glycoside hydrolase family 10 protein [Bacteroidales bacterium]